MTIPPGHNGHPQLVPLSRDSNKGALPVVPGRNSHVLMPILIYCLVNDQYIKKYYNEKLNYRYDDLQAGREQIEHDFH